MQPDIQEQRAPRPHRDATLAQGSLTDLRRAQKDREADSKVVCPACQGPVSASGCHDCKWCGRIMHAFCGEPDRDSQEGHGQRRVCATFDCINLRPTTQEALQQALVPVRSPARKRRKGMNK